MNKSLCIIPLLLVVMACQADADFIFPDFSGASALQLNGDARIVEDVLRLAPAREDVRGSAFTTTAIALGEGGSFSTYFQFRIQIAPGSTGLCPAF